MPLSYPLTFPTSPGPASVRLSMRNVVANSASPYSLESQAQRHPGQMWMADLTMPPLHGEAELGEWSAFLTALRGRWGSFVWAPPDRNRGSFASNQNLLLWSEDFTNAAWVITPTAVIITDNAGVAPNGTQTAELIQEAAGEANFHDVRTASNVLPSGEVTYSIFVKQYEIGNPRNIILIITSDNVIDGQEKRAVFSLSDGAVYYETVPGIATIQIVGGYYRCSLSVTATGTGNGFVYMRMVGGDGAQVYTGDGISGIYIWGAQLNKGSAPSAYLKTTSGGTYEPRVDGASQTGESLATAGWTASAFGLLKAGDLIQLGSGGSARLYRVLTDVDPDADGKATIDIWPRLRSSPPDGGAVVINNAAGLWRLSDNAASILLEPALIARVQFSIEEYL